MTRREHASFFGLVAGTFLWITLGLVNDQAGAPLRLQTYLADCIHRVTGTHRSVSQSGLKKLMIMMGERRLETVSLSAYQPDGHYGVLHFPPDILRLLFNNPPATLTDTTGKRYTILNAPLLSNTWSNVIVQDGNRFSYDHYVFIERGDAIIVCST